MRMQPKRFKAEVLTGHKGEAVEVPFDPVKEWGILPKPLWRGRRGHSVSAIINDYSFETAIVPRQKKFYLLIDAEAGKTAGILAGTVVRVEVKPNVE
jgi:hypothetical protein